MYNNESPKKQLIELQNGSLINQKIIDELELFLSLSSPQTMARSLNYVFYMYLFYEKDHPCDFKFIAEDFYILHEFFSGISGNAERVKCQF